MEQAFSSIPEEVKERLHAQGFKPFAYKPLSNYCLPSKPEYWLANLLIGGVCVVGRHFAQKNQSVSFVWSACLVGIPFFALTTQSRLDSFNSRSLHRKTLEERLDFYPVTRRAWNRAMEENEKYQNQLKSEIEDMEMLLSSKKRF